MQIWKELPRKDVVYDLKEGYPSMDSEKVYRLNNVDKQFYS